MVGCELCGSLHNLLRCAKCQNSYCESHQLSHWQTHDEIKTRDNILDAFSGQLVQSGWVPEPNDLQVAPGTCAGFQVDAASRLIPSPHFQQQFVLPGADCLQEEPGLTNPWQSALGSEYEQHWGAASSGDRQDSKRDFVSSPVVEGGEFLPSTLSSPPPYLHRNHKLIGHSGMPTTTNSVWLQTMCQYVIRDMDKYGICVIDNFAGQTLGNAILDEVVAMYTSGQFMDGEVMSKPVGNASKTIRGDKIVWVNGNEPVCKNIGLLIKLVDAIVANSNRMRGNGKLGEYTISDRTRAMVACYPGGGTQYVKHVDNPNQDGRCITCIYYLNKDWDVKRDGGLLRIFPRGWTMSVADIDPMFDRILLFWSDRRNPHEVQPALRTRYAITLWYYDKEERETAWRHRQAQAQQIHSANSANTIQPF